MSLILCTLGRTEQLLRLQQSLELQTCRDFEVIVVDQNPVGFLDSFLESAQRELRLRYVRSEPGLSRARNVGLQVCQGDIIGFPDDDCWFPPTLVAQVVETFKRHPTLDFITGRTTDAGGRDSNGRFLRTSRSLTRANIWFCGTSNSIFIRRTLSLAVRGFDETLGVGAGTPFGSGEETELLLRALACGHRGSFFHELVVHHDQTDQEIDQRALLRAAAYARGFGRVLRMHRYSIGYLLYRVGRNLLAALQAQLSRQTARAQLKLTWARSTLLGYFSPRGTA
jgi:glycosyltransferase involved in cell wall biosynthesis